jgi:hypothetical protein
LDDELARPDDEPLDSFGGCVRAILAIASGVALLGWIYVVLVSLGWSGFPKSLFEALLLIFPFIYLSSSIYCCWHFIPWRALFITALLLNLPLAAIGIYAVIVSGTFSLGIFACVLFLILWIFLCVARVLADNAAT